MQLALLAETGEWTSSSRVSKKAGMKRTGANHQRAVPALAVATRPAARATLPSSTAMETMPCSDVMLHMRDVVRVTRRHRATIYRLIKRKLFPEQRTHKGKKIGWARSDIERWMQGDPALDS
jgi:predicted DNA-binding transcriptional regulator AlpA